MSYEIIKRITFNEKNRTVSICGCPNNVSPRTYHAFDPLHGEHDYEDFKRWFAEDLFDGQAEFLPSCRSKARDAYLSACAKLNVPLSDCSDWACHPLYSAANRMFPHTMRYDYGEDAFRYDPQDARARYEQFRETWCDTFVAELNALLAA